MTDAGGDGDADVSGMSHRGKKTTSPTATMPDRSTAASASTSTSASTSPTYTHQATDNPHSNATKQNETIDAKQDDVKVAPSNSEQHQQQQQQQQQRSHSTIQPSHFTFDQRPTSTASASSTSSTTLLTNSASSDLDTLVDAFLTASNPPTPRTHTQTDAAADSNFIHTRTYCSRHAYLNAHTNIQPVSALRSPLTHGASIRKESTSPLANTRSSPSSSSSSSFLSRTRSPSSSPSSSHSHLAELSRAWSEVQRAQKQRDEANEARLALLEKMMNQDDGGGDGGGSTEGKDEVLSMALKQSEQRVKDQTATIDELRSQLNALRVELEKSEESRRMDHVTFQQSQREHEHRWHERMEQERQKFIIKERQTKRNATPSSSCDSSFAQLTAQHPASLRALESEKQRILLEWKEEENRWNTERSNLLQQLMHAQSTTVSKANQEQHDERQQHAACRSVINELESEIQRLKRQLNEAETELSEWIEDASLGGGRSSSSGSNSRRAITTAGSDQPQSSSSSNSPHSERVRQLESELHALQSSNRQQSRQLEQLKKENQQLKSTNNNNHRPAFLTSQPSSSSPTSSCARCAILEAELIECSESRDSLRCSLELLHTQYESLAFAKKTRMGMYTQHHAQTNMDRSIQSDGFHHSTMLSSSNRLNVDRRSSSWSSAASPVMRAANLSDLSWRSTT